MYISPRNVRYILLVAARKITFSSWDLELWPTRALFLNYYMCSFFLNSGHVVSAKRGVVVDVGRRRSGVTVSADWRCRRRGSPCCVSRKDRRTSRTGGRSCSFSSRSPTTSSPSTANWSPSPDNSKPVSQWFSELSSTPQLNDIAALLVWRSVRMRSRDQIPRWCPPKKFTTYIYCVEIDALGLLPFLQWWWWWWYSRQRRYRSR